MSINGVDLKLQNDDNFMSHGPFVAQCYPAGFYYMTVVWLNGGQSVK